MNDMDDMDDVDDMDDMYLQGPIRAASWKSAVVPRSIAERERERPGSLET